MRSSGLTPCSDSTSSPWFSSSANADSSSVRVSSLSGLSTVVANSYSRSDISIPNAENAAGTCGTMVSVMPISRASIGPRSGPAPPKASSANSRGSSARSTVISRSAPTVRASRTRRTLAAAWGASIPSGRASLSSTAARAASASMLMSPSRNAAGSR